MRLTSLARPSPLRVGAVAAAAVALLASAAFAFWHEDIRYSLPTRRPAGLVQASIGASMPVDAWLAQAGVEAKGRPVLVHFFNAECPCSRFNLEHVRHLVATFGDRVTFIAAVQTDADDSPGDQADLARRVRDLDLRMPWFVDRQGRAAAAAGVYSTPQAAVVDAEGRLRFRGNFNASRYCTDPRTEFARIALEAMLTPMGANARADASASRQPAVELPAYGCELPSAAAATATATQR